MIKEEVIETPPPDALAQARATRNPIKKLYFWTLHWADTKYALPALVLVAFAESSFFPVPPDVLLIAMCFSSRRHWLKYALWCSAASVLGGVFGWYIGYGLYEAIGKRIIEAFHYGEAFQLVQSYYEKNAFLYIVTAAFTPIPYKVFTIAAGVFHEQVSLQTLVLASTVGRTARFLLVAVLIRYFGEKVKPFLEKHFELATLALGAVAVLGFVALKWLR